MRTRLMEQLSLSIVYGGCYWSFSECVNSLNGMTLNAKYDCFFMCLFWLEVISGRNHRNATISAFSIYTVQSFGIFIMLTFLFSWLKLSHSLSQWVKSLTILTACSLTMAFKCIADPGWISL